MTFRFRNVFFWFAVAAGSASGQQIDYFPLQPGNQWIYRLGGTFSGPTFGTTLTLEILRSGEFNGRTYSLLHGLPQRDYWLRSDADGSVLSYDPDQNKESVWYLFQSPEGQVYETTLPYCCGRAAVRSTSAKYDGPLGTFDSALEMTYPGVFQVGLVRDLFLPYIGMVYRDQNTGGPSHATYDLIYARIAGVTVVSEKEVAFGVSLDRTVYDSAATKMTVRITLRNTQDQPLTLMFGSGQIYEIVLKNEAGDIVYRWSDGKVFTQALISQSFGPGEKNYAVIVPLVDKAGKPLASGKYTAEGWLATIGSRSFSASVGFEVKIML